MAEQFKIYLNSLRPDKIDKIENDFQANGNGLGLVRDAQSIMKLFDSFVMFYYVNGTLSYTNCHLFVLGGDAPSGIIGEKLNLKELFAKFFRTKSNAVSKPHLSFSTIFCGKRNYSKELPHKIV